MDTAITSPSSLRLLLIKTSSMGDLVHALSALEEARLKVPALAVDWVAEESFTDVARLSPAVVRVIPVAARRWRQNLLSASTYREIAAFARALRSETYDCVIDAQGLVKSAWITALAQCPSQSKWGFDRASIRERLAGIVLDHRAHAPSDRHAIERLRTLFGAALGYVPASDPALLQSPRLEAKAPQMPTSRFVIFVHGTSRPVKAWPIKEWSALAQAIAAKGFGIALPWGSAQERQAAQDIARAASGQALVLPRQTIGQLAALMMAADAVVGVDSGLTHLSAALARPTVAVMPAGLMQRYAATRFAPPWRSHVRVVVPASDHSVIDAALVRQALLPVLQS